MGDAGQLFRVRELARVALLRLGAGLCPFVLE